MSSASSATIPQGNRLLDSLSPAEQADLAPHLEQVRLELKELLFEAGKRIDSVYFPLTAGASFLHPLGETPWGESAPPGQEGLGGPSVSLGVKTLTTPGVVRGPVRR